MSSAGCGWGGEDAVDGDGWSLEAELDGLRGGRQSADDEPSGEGFIGGVGGGIGLGGAGLGGLGGDGLGGGGLGGGGLGLGGGGGGLGGGDGGGGGGRGGGLGGGLDAAAGEAVVPAHSTPAYSAFTSAFTNAKAGMEGVDTDKVKRLVHEMSKDSVGLATTLFTPCFHCTIE